MCPSFDYVVLGLGSLFLQVCSELLFESRSSSEELAFHCRDREVEGGCNFFVGHSLIAAQNDSETLLFGKALNSCVDRGTEFVLLKLFVGL